MNVKNIIYKSIGIFSIVFVSGCVAIDSRVKEEIPRKVEGIEAFSGKYANEPIYQSESMGFVGPHDITYVTGHLITTPDSFSIVANSDTGLIIELLKSGDTITTKEYSFDGGLELTEEGVLKLPKETDAGGHDSPVVGFASNQILFYLNTNDELVVVTSGGGAGIVGIFPMVVYGKLMAIFPRQP